MFTVDDSRVGVVGDWHGDTWWGLQALKVLHNAGVSHVFHLGDFGFWGGQDSAKYVRKVSYFLQNNNMNMYVTAGNHEDYPRIFSRPKDENGLWVYADRLKVFPRGFHGIINNVDFVSLGGANSIDFKNRVKGKSWWEEEQISVDDYTNAVSQGKKTLMFCHDAPYGVPMEYERKTVDNGWDVDEVEYSNRSRKVLREVINITQPEVLFHGHHHVFQDVETVFETVLKETFTVRTVGLHKEREEGNIVVFNVDSSTYDVLMP